MCGKGKRLDYLKSLATKLGVAERTHFLGYRKDVVDICFQSNVFVMPSKREGLGLAALEAMYCGLPLITTRTRGLVDFMEDGVSGYLHSCNDVAGFSKSIEKLSCDEELCKKMGENNREKVVPYCLENTKCEVLDVVNGLINNKVNI